MSKDNVVSRKDKTMYFSKDFKEMAYYGCLIFRQLLERLFYAQVLFL